MTLASSSFVLLLCSTLTGLIVEALKKMVELKKPNITAAIISVIVGTGVSIGYILLKNIPFNVESILYIISIVILSWLIAMLGYDKVMQSLIQLKGLNNANKEDK